METKKGFAHLNMITDNNMVKKINCSNNELIRIPDNMNFPNLQYLDCENKKLTCLPDNMNFSNLQQFYCCSNKLTCLPLCIMTYTSLTTIRYENNPIDLPIQLMRFINRIRDVSVNMNKINDLYNGGSVKTFTIRQFKYQ